MPARKKLPAGPPPLTDDDVTTLRDRLQSGERPRVVVRAASAAVPAGTRGSIVRIGQPSDGEYVVVRLGKDEVPFAPAELALPSRAKAAPAPPAPVPSARKSAAVRTSAPRQAARKPAATKPPAPPKPAAAPTPAPRRSASRKTPTPLTLVLQFDGGGWTVEALRGSRRVARASAVRPGAVKAFADLVDDAAVRDAVTETIDSCRSVVEERAAALRAELAAAEAALKDYESRRR